MKINKSPVRLYASEKAVIQQFLHLPGQDRVENVVNKVVRFDEEEVVSNLAIVMNEFGSRHRDLINGFLDHFKKVSQQYDGDLSWFSESRKLLLGAYFTKEYSIQSAALFNPSIVSHPDQSNLKADEQRFVISLRATGEGHISSVVFKTGIINHNAQITLEKDAPYWTPLKRREETLYTKEFLQQRIACYHQFKKEILHHLPESFTAHEAIDIIDMAGAAESASNHSTRILKEVFDRNYELFSASKLPLPEKVVFPSSNTESMGIEDVRFVRF